MTRETPEAIGRGIDPVRTLVLAALVCAALAFSPEPPRHGPGTAAVEARLLPEGLVREDVLATPLGQDVHPHL